MDFTSKNDYNIDGDEKMQEELIDKIIKAIDELRPYLNMESGDIEFVKYEDNYLYIRLIGACEACEFQEYTINEGLESYFKAQIPDLEGIINVNL